jgi:hypothetical protein
MVCLLLFSFLVNDTFDDAKEYLVKAGSEYQYSDYIDLPVHLRKQLYPELNQELKTSFWIQNLELALQTQDLDQDQAAFIVYALEQLESGILEIEKTDALYDLKVTSSIESMKKKALELFNPEQIFRIFMMIGPYDPDEAMSSTSSSAEFIPDCNCRWFCWPTKCAKKPKDPFFCKRVNNMCGWWGGDPCDGLCGG